MSIYIRLYIRLAACTMESMRFIADFHIHSKYARATSKDMNIEELDKWANIKGITVLGTGDFTHPEWFKELKEKLEPAEPGLFKFREASGDDSTRFMLTVEVSSIYSKGGKVRKIHTLIFAPSFEVVDNINTQLSWVGNLKADGRPILGLDAKELAKMVFSVSDECMLVPAHAWTPWFSVFGSKSGFDSLEECFEDYTDKIFAIETGLSSDPAMNWRVSKLDTIALISNSDSHSGPKIGREANMFDTELSYRAIYDALKSKDPTKFLSTIEFFPEEGKYHYDGHRLCKFSCNPARSKELNNICPVCSRPLTIGVMNRVEELADRPDGEKPEGAIPYKNLIPLTEIIGDALGVGQASKRVNEYYMNLIRDIGTEFKILVEASRGEIEAASIPSIAEGVIRVREGEVKIEPGYDGEYGKIQVFAEDETRETGPQQETLF